jgi:DNA-binding transcriptional LysR family regulator
MKRNELNDLAAFVVVAEAGNFTRAAAKLDMSQSALSHAMRQLEERLGIRLLARTTRSVSTTEAGRRLLRTLRSALAEISAEIAGQSEFRDKPAGTPRITTAKHPVFLQFGITQAIERLDARSGPGSRGRVGS